MIEPDWNTLEEFTAVVYIVEENVMATSDKEESAEHWANSIIVSVLAFPLMVKMKDDIPLGTFITKVFVVVNVDKACWLTNVTLVGSVILMC
jgi:hypothetical protein